MGGRLEAHGGSVNDHVGTLPGQGRHYENFIDAFTDYGTRLGASPTYLRWVAVSMIAGVIGRKAWINYQNTGTQVYPNHFIFLIGPAGIAKKSSSAGHGIKILKAMQSLTFTPEQITQASLLDTIQEAGFQHKFEYNNTEYANSSVYSFSSEAANFLSEISGPIIELLTEFWDCGTNGWTDISWKRRTKGGGEIRIYNPCVNMLACSTPTWLVKTIGKENIESGFASRCLFVVQNRATNTDKGWGEQEDTLQFSQIKEKLLSDLQTVSMLRGEFKVTKSFIDAYNDFRPRLVKFIEQNPEHRLINYYARKEWHIMKLSQVLSAASNMNMVITAHHFNKAVQWLTELEKDMLGAFGDATTDSKLAVNVTKVWEKVRTKKAFTIAQLSSWFYKKLNLNDIRDCIAILIQMDRIDSVTKVDQFGKTQAVFKVLVDTDLDTFKHLDDPQ